MASNRLIEVRVNGQDQWYWHAKSPRNGKITFQGEGHPNEAKAIQAIERELNALGATKTVDVAVFKGPEDTKPVKKFSMHWLSDGTITRFDLLNRGKPAEPTPAPAPTPMRTKVSVTLPPNTKNPMKVMEDIQTDLSKPAKRHQLLEKIAADPISAPLKKAITTRERAVVAKKASTKK